MFPNWSEYREEEKRLNVWENEGGAAPGVDDGLSLRLEGDRVLLRVSDQGANTTASLTWEQAIEAGAELIRLAKLGWAHHHPTRL